MEKVKLEMQKVKPQMEQSLKEAREQIEKAKKELTVYKTLIDGLEKDGLIDRKGTYTIQYKDGDLIINDKKQPAEVTNKYKDMLSGHKNFTIKKTNDDFDIDNDND
jgi:hypothetical protein